MRHWILRQEKRGRTLFFREGDTGKLVLKPEEKARKDIDRLHEAAGWQVQDLEDMATTGKRYY